MDKQNITEYTEAEFLDLVKKICDADHDTENKHTEVCFFCSPQPNARAERVSERGETAYILYGIFSLRA
ncbi:bacteriocin immunity protein [Pseudomonas petroselini]|uniref:bacteriocin immunity protein n=1 Tax=Pseudomonas petroselini TaxID=2899822 RepID=UPI003868B015